MESGIIHGLTAGDVGNLEVMEMQPVQDGDQPKVGMVVGKGWNKDDNNMKEDNQLESGSDEEFLKELDMSNLSGVNNSFRERKVPDSCMSGRQDGASRMTPESGTNLVTTVNGDLVVKCRTTTAVQKGTARSNIFPRSSHLVDDGGMKTPVVISIPDTSSDEGMVTEDEKDDNIRSPQRQSDEEDDLIPSTLAPSNSRRRKCIEKLSGKFGNFVFGQ